MSANKFHVRVGPNAGFVGGSAVLQRLDDGTACVVKIVVNIGAETITRKVCFEDFIRLMRHAVVTPEEWLRP